MSGRQVAINLGRAALQRPGLAHQQLFNAALRRLDSVQSGRRHFATHFGGFGFEGFPGAGPGGGGPPRGDTEKFYKILGVEKSASEADIKRAYKKQAMKHHPDRGGDEGTFKDISKAYEVLSNPEKKQIYDMYGEEGLEGMGQGGAGPGGHPGMDPFDLFGSIFGFNPGRSGPRGKPVTQDSRYELQVSLEELYKGTSRTIVYHRDVLCSACNGVGGTKKVKCMDCNGTGRQVVMQNMGIFVQRAETQCASCRGRGYHIPKGSLCNVCHGKCTVKEEKRFTVDIRQGLQDGKEFRFPGQADEQPGHDAGDVVIIVRQKPHETFKRIKDSLVMSKKISLSEALCGFRFSVPFLDGEDLEIRSQPGQVVRPGDVMVIKGKGMPRPHQQPGDLFLELDVDFPEAVKSEDHTRLQEILGGAPAPETSAAKSEVASKLNRRRVQELRQHMAQESQGGQQVGCQQM